MSSHAFDALAAGYDAEFTQTRLGQMLRARVWQTLAQVFAPGQRVLELACGTGEDAVWLARRGVEVTAVDGSGQMVAVAQQKVQQSGLASGAALPVTVAQVSWQELIESEVGNGRAAYLYTLAPFDGALSNFGGLNTLPDWAGVAAALSRLIRPGGALVLVPMGPLCPWEVGWYLAHGQVRQARRRLAYGATPATAVANIGPHTIPIWYPAARRLTQAFAPWFAHQYTASLGLWLPPSYLGHLVDRWPRLFARLNRWEEATAHLTRGWGDHYIWVGVRRGQT